MASKEVLGLIEPKFGKEIREGKLGDIQYLSDDVLIRFYYLRIWADVPFIPTAGAAYSGHSKNSQHYPKFDGSGKLLSEATAIDSIVLWEDNIIDFILAAISMGFTGLGYYPDGMYNGNRAHRFHFDCRKLKEGQKAATWLAKKVDGKTQYLALDYQNLLIHSKLPEDEGETH
jgi:hypothetical protein